MIIDSHAHVILPSKKHIELMDEAGVDKTILFSTSMHPETADNLTIFERELNKLHDIISGKVNSIETKIASIEEQAEVISKYPSRFYGFGNVPLGMNYEDTASWIDKYVIKNNFIGLGEFSVLPGTMKNMDTVFKVSRDYSNLPIWIHGFWPLDLEDIKEIFNLSKQYPEIPIIIGHLGGVNWLEVVKKAKEVNNIYIDLSAAYASVALEMAIKEAPEKCLFSSDIPYGDLTICKFSIERVCKDKSIREKVLGGNIQELLRL